MEYSVTVAFLTLCTWYVHCKCVCVYVHVSMCMCVCLSAVSAPGREMIGSPLRASRSLQHVETMARCQDTSPQSVLTSRHEEQRLIIYKHTPVCRDDLALFLH